MCFLKLHIFWMKYTGEWLNEPAEGVKLSGAEGETQQYYIAAKALRQKDRDEIAT